MSDTPKIQASTALEKDEMQRLERIARIQRSSTASVIRRCVEEHLPEIEREVLGAPVKARKKEAA